MSVGKYSCNSQTSEGSESALLVHVAFLYSQTYCLNKISVKCRETLSNQIIIDTSSKPVFGCQWPSSMYLLYPTWINKGLPLVRGHISYILINLQGICDQCDVTSVSDPGGKNGK